MAREKRSNPRTPVVAALVVVVTTFILYLATLAPSFGFVDKGELAAVAATLGIAHPTGYPTLMLLGYVFTRVLPLRDVVAVNVMAALLTACGAGMMTLLLYDLLRRDLVSEPELPRSGKKKKRKLNRSTAAVAPVPHAAFAGLGALFIALTAPWWSQGTSFEVYALHILMLPLLTRLFLRFLEEPGNPPNGLSRRGAWFGFALGLSFTNHMTTVLLAPAFLLLFFWTFGVQRGALSRMVRLVPPFVAGLLPYAWLPWRASMHPTFNWGNPTTLKRFIDHVTGKQYRVWMFTNPDAFHEQTRYFLSRLPSEVAYVGLILTVAGIYEMSRRNVKLTLWSVTTLAVGLLYLLYGAGRLGIIPYGILGIGTTAIGVRVAGSEGAKLSVALTLLFITCTGYAGGYDIMEIQPYYLTAVFAVGIWVGMGLLWLRRTVGRSPALATAALLVITTGWFNYADSNERGHTSVEDMTIDVLDHLPENALIFSAQWDFWVSGSWYMQAVEGLRSDVLVVDPELLRRSWYLDQLETNHPELMREVEEEEARYREHLARFEHGLPYDAAAIDAAYRGLIDALIDTSLRERPVLVTAEVNPRLGARYRRVPYFLAYRLMPDDRYLPQELPRYRYRPIDEPISIYTAQLAELYARSAYARAIYELQHGAQSLADRYFELAVGFDPHVDMEDVPPQPLDGNERVAATLRWFRELREALR